MIVGIYKKRKKLKAVNRKESKKNNKERKSEELEPFWENSFQFNIGFNI